MRKWCNDPELQIKFISQKIAKEQEIHMDCHGTFDTFWTFLQFIFTAEKETNA